MEKAPKFSSYGAVVRLGGEVKLQLLHPRKSGTWLTKGKWLQIGPVEEINYIISGNVSAAII